MSEILKLALANLDDWPAALVAIVAIICFTAIVLARSANRIAALGKYLDERSDKMAIRKAQRKCQHRWSFRPFRSLGWEEYTTCVVCRLKLPTEQVAFLFPDQFQAAQEFYKRDTQKDDDVSPVSRGLLKSEIPGFVPGKNEHELRG